MESHRKTWKFYDKKSLKLKNITKLKPWPLYNVFLEKYRMIDSEAKSLASFLECMLKWNPKDRQSARQLLNHRWLQESDNYDIYMSRSHLREFKIVNIGKFPGYL